MILVLSSSLNSDSKSRLLALEAKRVLETEGHATRWIDLRDFTLPFCDAGEAYDHPQVQALTAELDGASGIIVATAIYNYDANAALKNLIELTGSAWENKVVGFLCAAGGMSSYMSIMPLANSLMLDFRSLIVPRFVYATPDAFRDRAIVSNEIAQRVSELALQTARLADANARVAA